VVITVKFSDDGIFGNYTGEDVDRTASAASFAEHLEAALDHDYPNAEIEIAHGIDDSVSIDGRGDHDEVPWIEQTVNRVWESYDWLQGS
jgi:hypothetical protein